MAFTEVLSRRFDGALAEVERLRQNLALVIKELQSVSILRGRLIKGIVLENGVHYPVAHGMGRPVAIIVSPIKSTPPTAGIIETPDHDLDPNRYITLRAISFGATVTVDAWVFPA